MGEFPLFLGGLPEGVWQVTFLEGWSVLYGLVKNRNLNTSEASIKSSLNNFFVVFFWLVKKEAPAFVNVKKQLMDR